MTAAVVAVATALSGACASRQDTIRQQREKLESLGASTALLVDDFLAGQLSPTYARTALDALFVQVEQQRAALASEPDTLVDGTAASLSQRAEQLSRLVAQMRQDVARDDAGALRARRGSIPLLPGRQ